MKKRLIIIILLIMSCDPVHDLLLENSTKNSIEILFYPELSENALPKKNIETIEHKGLEMYKLILNQNKKIIIGTAIARYTPSAHSIDLDYLEVRNEKDTIVLVGKNAILSAIQKVKKLDWRLIVK